MKQAVLKRSVDRLTSLWPERMAPRAHAALPCTSVLQAEDDLLDTEFG
jgi:hypothetical protein